MKATYRTQTDRASGTGRRPNTTPPILNFDNLTMVCSIVFEGFYCLLDRNIRENIDDYRLSGGVSVKVRFKQDTLKKNLDDIRFHALL